MERVETVVLLCLSVVNCVLHGLGFFLLSHLHKKNFKSPQKLYILNLSLSELVQNISRLIVYALKVYWSLNYPPSPTSATTTAPPFPITTLVPTTHSASTYSPQLMDFNGITLFSIHNNNNNNNNNSNESLLFPISPLPHTLDVPLSISTTATPNRITAKRFVGMAIVHMQFILNTGVLYQCLMAMFVLTGDRLVCILLDIRYPVYFTFSRSLIIVGFMWMVSVSTTLSVCTYVQHLMVLKDRASMGTLDSVIQVYVISTLVLMFLIFAVFSYTIMFKKFLHSRRSLVSSEDPTHKVSAWQTFRKSKFFICVLLVSSFLVFSSLPTLIQKLRTLITGTPHNQAPIFLRYVNISLLLSDTADGLIYVFLKPDVRKLLKKKMSVRSKTVRSRYHGFRVGKKSRASMLPDTTFSTSTTTTTNL